MKFIFCFRPAALMAALLLLTGCGTQEALKYNNNIVNANQQLAAAGTSFGQAIVPAVQGQDVNLEEVRRTYKNAQDTVQRIKTETTTWKVPSSASAQDLQASYLRFLKLQEEGINKFGDIVKVLENPKGSRQDKAQKIQTVLLQLDQIEKPALAELQSKQATFAKAHNLKLTPAK